MVLHALYARLVTGVIDRKNLCGVLPFTLSSYREITASLFPVNLPTLPRTDLL